MHVQTAANGSNIAAIASGTVMEAIAEQWKLHGWLLKRGEWTVEDGTDRLRSHVDK